ncbi:2-amino-4-hydroxy-6-hydroxymethyldihydropteridine diphosphokinase [Pseudomonas sp. CGJS7]|uniref:2-amino-4-hydroxy-6- hydroxymethyldihydropteridine diphosphokinase n=1 Tax=Pseudomonas sp. CGJS7 TaxID=3109348 RepID=UPI0030095D82
MSWIALICLGASDGARVENLLEAAAQLTAEAGADSLRGVSELYGDRHRPYRGGATVNLMLALEWRGATPADAALERRFKQLEAEFGRERDPRRQMPVPLDIDLVGRIDGAPRWQARYDPGRPYLFHGLRQLPLPALQEQLTALAGQRGFDPEHNASGFYCFASAAFVQRYLREAADRLASASQRETG